MENTMVILMSEDMKTVYVGGKLIFQDHEFTGIDAMEIGHQYQIDKCYTLLIDYDHPLSERIGIGDTLETLDEGNITMEEILRDGEEIF